MELYTSIHHSPIGEIRIISNHNAILELLLPGQLTRAANPLPVPAENDPTNYAKRWLDDYFAGKRPLLDTDWLLLRGTEFQMQVWQILTQIPYGQTITYRDIAQEICRQNQIPKMSAQAVGQAVGRNPVAIMVPCHRVIGADGKLTGYAGGVELKRMLLEHEGSYKEKVL